MPEPSPSQIDTLLEQCILALDGPDEHALDAILDGHPDAAPALRERLDNLAALGILRARSTSSGIPERLGEFRLLRQIGHGGMGVVYLAEQEPLQRQVALKLVHPEQLFFGGARERFRREVLAVARLQHQGIVPILTSGEADGIPYYAMELVQGASLGEVLAELAGVAPMALDGPMLRSALQRAMAKKRDLAGTRQAPVFDGAWTNACCRLVRDAAVALQHAHDHGVLHRDVKPTNLLLTADGTVRLIDFGLASARGEQRLTRSGATLGSLPYMAPEQVRGDLTHIDARTDVYALGVTMYELLTLSLPHGEEDGTLRERILAGHLESPSRRNGTIHPDAEAICLVALDVDPARRYRSAAAMADDLTAFLEHRTVRARRPSPLLRTVRWIRRRPARAAAIAVGFLTLVPGSLALAWQQSAAAARVQRAFHAAEEQRHRAETNFELALRAVDQLLLRTADARLGEAPRTAELRRDLLQDAIAFHETLIAESGPAPDDPRAVEDRARAQSRLGALQADLGDLDRAATLLRSAIESLTMLLPTSARPAALRIELATAWEQLACVHARTDRVDEEEAAHRRAIELFDAAPATSTHPRVVEGVSRARLALAVCLERRQRVSEAFAVLEELERRFASGLADDNAPTMQSILSAEVADHRGILLARTGDTQGAQQAFAEAMRRLDALPDADRERLAAISLRAGLLERLGLIAQQRREWEVAVSFLDRASADYERLLQDEPSIARWPLRLARVLGARASTRVALHGPSAGTDHDRAVVLLEQALAKTQTEGALRRALAIALAERAAWHQAAGNHSAALADFARAAEGLSASLDAQPGDDPTRGNLASVLASQAMALQHAGDLPAARACAEHALEVCRGCRNTEGQRSLVELLAMTSDLAMRAGDVAAAIAFVEEATERAAALLAEAPDDAARQLTVAMTSLNHGTALINARDPDAAVERLVAGLSTARAVAGHSALGRQTLALTLLRLVVATRLRVDGEATRWFRAAIDETGIDTSRLANYPTLRDLFAEPEFRAALPAGHPDR